MRARGRPDPSTPLLYVVDPYLVTPERDAVSFLEREMRALTYPRGAAGTPARPCVRVFTPAQEGVAPLRSALERAAPMAVVSLGSFANLTDVRPWMDELGSCLQREVVETGTPFLGICFSHQLLAHTAGDWSVGPVPKERRPRGGKWEGPRLVTVTHPKLRLLLTPFAPGERGAHGARDLAFGACVRETHTWDATRWDTVFKEPEWRLSAREARVRMFVERHCPKGVCSVASHEQEVTAREASLARRSHRSLVPAACSAECALEAFVHASLPAYTFQTHPERAPTSQGVLSNFLFLAHLVANGLT